MDEGAQQPPRHAWEQFGANANRHAAMTVQLRPLRSTIKQTGRVRVSVVGTSRKPRTNRGEDNFTSSGNR